MSIAKVPKSVSKIWKVLINANCRFLTAQEIAEELNMQANSVLQNVNRNPDYFYIIDQKPILVGPKPLTEFFLLRDNCNCIFCNSQLARSDSLVDTLDYPEKNAELKLYNAAVVCNSCKSKRYLLPNRNLAAEEFAEKTDPKKSATILKRINQIRDIKNILPLSYNSDSKHHSISNNNLIEKISDLEKEVVNLKSQIDQIQHPRSFEYYEVHFFELENLDDENDTITYWGWDWDPDRGYPGGEFEYWYFSQREKVTLQGAPAEKSFDQVLDYFGRLGYEIVHMEWLEDTEYSNETEIFFKKENRS